MNLKIDWPIEQINMGLFAHLNVDIYYFISYEKIE